MKPVLITFFLVLLVYSLVFDEKEDVVDSQYTESVSEIKEKVTIDQDEYETYYAKMIQNSSDSLVDYAKTKDFTLKK